MHRLGWEIITDTIGRLPLNTTLKSGKYNNLIAEVRDNAGQVTHTFKEPLYKGLFNSDPIPFLDKLCEALYGINKQLETISNFNEIRKSMLN